MKKIRCIILIYLVSLSLRLIACGNNLEATIEPTPTASASVAAEPTSAPTPTAIPTKTVEPTTDTKITAEPTDEVNEVTPTTVPTPEPTPDPAPEPVVPQPEPTQEPAPQPEVQHPYPESAYQPISQQAKDDFYAYAIARGYILKQGVSPEGHPYDYVELDDIVGVPSNYIAINLAPKGWYMEYARHEDADFLYLGPYTGSLEFLYKYFFE